MALDKPTVLLVHGVCHTADHFLILRTLLEKAGYPTCCPTLPSIDAAPPTGLIEDAGCITEELTRLVDREGKNVIVVGHSYGGIVVTQAVDASFSKRNREAAGAQGGVLQLLYISAYLPGIGESLSSVRGFGSSLPSYMTPNDRGQIISLSDPEWRFYNDLPTVDRAKWAAQLKAMSTTAITSGTTFAAYLHHPVAYLLCEADQSVAIQTQQNIIAKVMDSYGIQIRTRTCTAGHSPFLSQPEVVLTLVEDITGDENH